MQKQIYIFFFIISLLFSVDAFSQKYLSRGDEAYEREQFMQAITNYQKQVERPRASRRSRAEASYKMGMSFMKLSEPKIAISHFLNAIEYRYKNNSIYFDLSEAYLQYEEFDKAISALETYMQFDPGNAKAASGIARIHDIILQLENPNRYKVEIFALINSGELDYCPFYGYKDYDKLFFTSSRSVLNKPEVSHESGELFTDLYVMKRDRRTGEWSIPEKSLGSVNTEFDEGAASLNRRYNVLYFSRCEYDPKKDIGCRIYTAKRRSQYWSEVRELEIPGIPKNISIGHPSISDDELTLYFVADSMLGGYGGKDIYKTTRSRKSLKFSPPQNLGPDINSESDDCFPYVRKDGTLYFASDGHGSIGGLDLYKTDQLGPSSYLIESMGVPINSPADDFGIVFKDESEQGYFTSRRRGGVGKSDIYHFVLPGLIFEVSGIVWSKMENVELQGVEVVLCNQEGKELSKTITDKFGRYHFLLDKDEIYQLYFSKQPYLPASIRLSTKEIDKPKHFKKEVFLDNL